MASAVDPLIDVAPTASTTNTRPSAGLQAIRASAHAAVCPKAGQGTRETQLAERFYSLASGATHGTLPSTGITITYHLTRNTTITADRHHPENRRTCLHCANTNGA